jgi:hypothetical protein
MPIDTAYEYAKNEARLEGRVRAKARRCGLVVRKCRSRNPQWPGYGGFRIMDLFRNCIMAGGQHYSFSLQEIEAWLDDRPRDGDCAR